MGEEMIKAVDRKVKELIDPHQDLNSIFPAPQSLRHLYPNLLAPQFISFGPYHYDKFRQTDKHKARILKHVLGRTNLDLKDLVKMMGDIQDRARWSYIFRPEADLDSDGFVTMLLLDGIFILEFFSVIKNGHKSCGYAEEDPIFSERIYPFIMGDLLVLENQIPFFTLVQLYPFIYPDLVSDPLDTVKNLALHFLASCQIIPGHRWNLSHYQGEPLHILHIVALSLTQNGNNNSNHSSAGGNSNGPATGIVMHSLEKLLLLRVSLARKDCGHFMEIEYNRGVLKIPRLQIQQLTQHVFLNLVAFEHLYPQSDNHLTSYITFMASLMNTEHDVACLREKGIVEYWSGSDRDVVDLFNNLRKEVTFNPNKYYLSSVSKDLDQRFNSKFHNCVARWRKRCLKTFAVVVACMLFLLALVQCFYAVLGYHFPNSKN